MKRPFKLSVLLCVLAVVLTACETLPPAKPVPPPAQLHTLDEIARQLKARQADIHNVKSMVKSAVQTREHNHTLKQVLLIEGETGLRLDTLNMFSQPVGVLISDRTHILLYDPKSNRLYRDRDVWDIMYRNFGTVFDFRQFVSVFINRGQDILLPDDALPVAWADLDNGIVRIVAMKPRLCLEQVTVRWEHPSLTDDLVPGIGRPVERHKHEVQVGRQ